MPCYWYLEHSIIKQQFVSATIMLVCRLSGKLQINDIFILKVPVCAAVFLWIIFVTFYLLYGLFYISQIIIFDTIW